MQLNMPELLVGSFTILCTSKRLDNFGENSRFLFQKLLTHIFKAVGVLSDMWLWCKKSTVTTEV